MKTCTICQQSKQLSEFEITKSKNKTDYVRKICNVCKNKRDYERTKGSGQYDVKKMRNRARRHDPKFRVKFILQDSKTADIKNGQYNDLDEDFVSHMIRNGCCYCGSVASNQIKMGLDRIDNSVGHVKANVNPCCSRCNFIRRTMPYEAWMILVPAIRKVTEAGLLENWKFGFNHHQPGG